jgi:hypothetical protein
LILGKIAKHQVEIRALFTNVRAMGAAWRALGGPSFHNHFLRSLSQPGHQIPQSINGVTREHLIAVLAPLVMRHASPALQRDIEQYGDWVSATFLHLGALDEVPAAAARRWRPL